MVFFHQCDDDTFRDEIPMCQANHQSQSSKFHTSSRRNHQAQGRMTLAHRKSSKPSRTQDYMSIDQFLLADWNGDRKSDLRIKGSMISGTPLTHPLFEWERLRTLVD